MQMKRNIRGLDYIRGISAIFIMLYHYTTRYMDAEASHKGLWWGCWAVAAFFMLSGFLTDITVNENTSAATFMKKRVIRLYPVYWVGIAATSVVTLCYSRESFIGIKDTLINCTMFQGFLKGIRNVDGAYWTLRYELMFYIIIALLLFIGLYKYIYKLSFCYLIVIATLDFVNASRIIPIPHVINSVFDIILISSQAHLFLLGMSIAAVVRNRNNVLPYINILLCLFLNFERRGAANELFVLVVAALIFAAADNEFEFKYDRTLVTLASVSYPLYLMHQNIGFVIIDQLRGTVGYPAGVFAASVTMVAAAWLVHTYIEIPVTGFLKKKLMKSGKKAGEAV